MSRFPEPKNIRNKNIIVQGQTAKISKGHVQHHVTLGFKVIRKGHAFVTNRNEIPDPKTLYTKQYHRSKINMPKLVVEVTYNIT